MQGLIWGPPKAVVQDLILLINILRRTLASLHPLQPSGGKPRRFKYRFDGREKKLAIGTYPVIGLAEARRRRDQARERLAAGKDPSRERLREKLGQCRLPTQTGSFPIARLNVRCRPKPPYRFQELASPPHTAEIRSILASIEGIAGCGCAGLSAIVVGIFKVANKPG